MDATPKLEFDHWERNLVRSLCCDKERLMNLIEGITAVGHATVSKELEALWNIRKL